MLLEKLKKFFKKIEEDNKPIIFYIGSFISILIIRNFLEIFAYKSAISLIIFLHYSLVWTCIALLLALIINVFTSKKLKKIGKILIYFFPVVFIPPIIDIIFYGWGKFNITYLFPEYFKTAGVLNSLLFFTNNFEKAGISLGIKVEIFLILSFVFLYVYISEKNFLKSVVATIATYLMLFLSISIPTLINYFYPLDFSGIELTDLIISQIIAILIFVSCIGLIYKNNRNLIISFLRKINVLKLFAYILVFNGGFLLAILKNKLVIREVFFSYIFSILTILFFSLLAEYLKQLNEEKFNINLILIFIVCLAFSALGGENVFFFFLVFLGIVYLYNFPPFKLKNISFLSKLVLFFQYLILFILGYSLVGEVFNLCNFIIFF